MPTLRQKRVAQEIVANLERDKPLNGGEIAAKVGYAKDMVRHPKRVLESDGVKQELQVMGFTEVAADTVVQQILHNESEKAQDRLKAADLIYKRLSSYAPDKSDLNVKVIPIMGGKSVHRDDSDT